MLTFLLCYWLLPTEEECKTECLSDCNCKAVLFMNGECKKQRLPLRFGRRIQSEANVALIKHSLCRQFLDQQFTETVFGHIKAFLIMETLSSLRILPHDHIPMQNLRKIQMASRKKLAEEHLGQFLKGRESRRLQLSKDQTSFRLNVKESFKLR